jgi:hypothetical protein
VGACALLLSALSCTVLIGDQPVNCDVVRQECTQELFQDGEVICVAYSPIQKFTATACTQESDGSQQRTCDRTFCDPVFGFHYGYMNCSTKVNAVDGGFPNCVGPNCNGMCRTDTAYNDLLTNFSLDYRVCSLAPDGLACASLDPAPTQSGPRCFDGSQSTIIEQLQPANGRDVRASLISDQHSPACVPQPPVSTGAVYALSSLGTVSGGGTSTAIPVVRGTAAVQFQTLCDPDQGACAKSLDSLDANVADLTVSGAQLTNVSIKSLGSVAVNAGQIAAGALRLLVAGSINGAPRSVVVGNAAPMQISTASHAFSLQGSVSTSVVNSAGSPLPITAAVNVQGTPAPAGTVACLGFTPVQRLFGFEDPASWTSSAAALSLVTAPVTQGCGALGISGTGYIPIQGASFTTAGLATNSALSVDLFIPGNQPNPSYLGALQTYLTCPSGNVFNQYIGQVELTGRPQNQYSTLRFPLPSAVTATLGRGLADCSFGLALNVNQTNHSWLLDNLRFTP